MLTDLRPWGKYEVLLDAQACKVKRIIVNPDSQPSYQYHHKRDEIWVIVSGEGLVTIENVESNVSKGNVIHVPRTKKHRIKNVGEGELVFIEVQLGEYFGEDDIVRVEDDYDRQDDV